MPFPSKVNAEAILASAVRIVERDGLEALSMRALSARLSLTVSSLYRYYADRAALEAALVAYTAELLDAELKKIPNGTDRLARALRTYREFANDHPVLYSMLLGRGTYGPDTSKALKQLWNTFLDLVSAFTGRFDDTGSAVALWSFMHGFIALDHSGQFGKSGPQGGFDIGLNAMLKGLASVEIR